MEDNWETQEVINWLTNDEGAYYDCGDESADFIEDYVRKGNAPQGLYESFDRPPQSSFDSVNWESVAESLED